MDRKIQRNREIERDKRRKREREWVGNRKHQIKERYGD